MEPLSCTASVTATSCEIWAPTQSAKSVLQLAVTMTGLPESKITVHTMYLGGGLGRKAEIDFVSQAIQVGKAIGKPVKLMWRTTSLAQKTLPTAMLLAESAVSTLSTPAGMPARTASSGCWQACATASK